MNILRISLAIAAVSFFSAGLARADWIELANNDVISGDVVSLNDKEVKIKSENFGEMKVPRDKVTLIGLGDRPEPAAAASVNTTVPQSSSPAHNNPQVNKLMEQVLKGGDVRNMHRNLEQSKRGLRDLQRDMDGPSADTLDNYIKMLDFMSTIAPDLQTRQPEQAPSEQPDTNAEK